MLGNDKKLHFTKFYKHFLILVINAKIIIKTFYRMFRSVYYEYAII